MTVPIDDIVLRTAVEVLWVARFDYAAGRRLRLHSHDYAQLICIREGTGTFLLDRVNTPLAHGQAWFLAPSQVHGLRADSYLRTLDVKFTMDPTWEATLAAVPALTSHAPAAIADELKQVRDLARAGGTLARGAAAVHLQMALLELLLHHTGRPSAHDTASAHLPDDPVCAAALTYLHAHYAEPVSGETLSEALGYSYRHVRQRCVAALGVTPLYYLMHYRVRRAQELMFWSDYGTKDIAARVGFTTVHHFTRVFTDLVGVPPARWRADELGSIGRAFVLGPGVDDVLFV